MIYLKTVLMILLLLCNCILYAAEFCVTSAEELRNALAAAESNNAHDVLKIAEGSYVTNGSAFSYDENLGWDLEISGGWSEFFGNPCGQQLGGNPYSTVLDGDSNNPVLRIRLAGGADLLVSGITVINGYGEMGVGAGLHVAHNSESVTGDFMIENNVFINNEGHNGSALSLFGYGLITVRNSLFYANHANNSYAALILQQVGKGVYFTNNTVVFNTALEPNSGGIYLQVNNASQALVANNVLKDNLNRDMFLFGDGNIYLKNNDLGVLGGSNIPIENFNNFNLPPRFESGLLNFTPDVHSPLVNTGVKPCNICPFPIPFDESWSIGTNDLAGNLRNQHGQVDIGAFESSHVSDLIFWDTFD